MIVAGKILVTISTIFIFSSNVKNSVFAKQKFSKHVQFLNETLTDSKNITKGERAALFSNSRIFPFIDSLLNPFVISPESPSYGVPAIGIDQRPSFVPFRGGGSRPSCALNGLYCLYDNTYPRDEVNTIINRHYNDVRSLYSTLNRISAEDLLSFDNRTHRYRESGHFVCESKVEYVRPGWARNLRGEWLAIINTDLFPQVVRVEECKYANRRCEYLPPCYKSSCLQRYSFEKLLCVDPRSPDGRPIVDIFEIPNACSCFVENFIYY
ncbi:UNVERIFIED_CONTAM: hypothetical protein RMT77_006866 [Armadillidium vulgare]